MEKSKIKQILRESLAPELTVEEAQQKSKKYDMEYSEVQTKLQNTMLKQSQVMKAAGLGDPDDATARSLFSKKVRKDKNTEGGTYLFDERELASVIKVLNNPAAYLNAKN